MASQYLDKPARRSRSRVAKAGRDTAARTDSTLRQFARDFPTRDPATFAAAARWSHGASITRQYAAELLGVAQ